MELSTLFYVWKNAAVKIWAHAVIILTSFKSLHRNELSAILIANKYKELTGCGPPMDAERNKRRVDPPSPSNKHGDGWLGVNQNRAGWSSTHGRTISLHYARRELRLNLMMLQIYAYALMQYKQQFGPRFFYRLFPIPNMNINWLFQS